MQILDVRLEKIIIKNFKNVINGQLNFISGKKNSTAEMIGLYGQNGSGKTAMIDALSILKTLLCGKSLLPKFVDYIHVDADEAELSFEFIVSDTNKKDSTKLVYSFCLGKLEKFPDTNINEDKTSYDIVSVIKWEKISIRFSEKYGINDRLTTYIDTSSSNLPFKPKPKYNLLIGKKRNMTELLSFKMMSNNSSQSYVFSRNFVNCLRNDNNDDNYEKSIFMTVYESLIYYGNFRLFIFNVTDAAMMNLDVLPISFNYKVEDSAKVNGNIILPINGNGVIPAYAFEIVTKLIDNMNIVLKQIVPGLTVSVKKLSSEFNENNQEVFRIQLLSNKNTFPIPLCYESEGIKKIFTILQLLINVYNKYSFTVAIDELDSGVFEYLLGEIIRIISEKGKGQLLFTSHNLRPLETLDKSCIAFTTTNPSNRYIRPVNIKASNNLRDYYYRDIMLGEQKEEVYEYTNNLEISYAFREAGEDCGS